LAYIKDLTTMGAITPPAFVPMNVQYETITGSLSYGVSSDASDLDLAGFCIPDRELVFPHTAGEIQGFGTQIQRFEQYQQHHIQVPGSNQEYDITIYNIVKFFQLCMENNPNMVDALYTPERCVTHISDIGKMVRSNADLFLHKGSWHKFKGYAYAQMSKIRKKSNSTNPKRAESIEKFGYDVKFAYHVVRLINEVEQIMAEGTLDIERSREQLKSIRRGEWTIEELESHFNRREVQLEELYLKSTLPHRPNEVAIKNLLLQCLEAHFGSLDALVTREDRSAELVADLKALLAKYK
jgi:uncharacterized protein